MAYDYELERVIDAIKGSFGIVSHIANKLACDWHTAKKYIDKWEATRRAFSDENERALDLSETQLLKAIQNGDGQMIRFHLATKGKQRGYTERQEITGAGGGPQEVVLKVVYGDDGDTDTTA